MSVIINAIVMTMDASHQLITHGFLRFEQDKITEIGTMQDYRAVKDESVIDAKGGILMPGMVNTHTHLGMIPFRGLQDDAVDRLRRFLLPTELNEMTQPLVYAASKYAMAELLLSGVTTFMDMYYFEGEVAKAADEMKIRAFVGETIIDQEVCDAKCADESLSYAESLIKAYLEHPLITAYVAPHSTISCSSETLIKARDLALKYDVPLSLHVAEMEYEMAHFKAQYQSTPIEYLNTLNMINARLVAAHCIFMSESDLELFNTKGANVAHCIGSNTKAAKGVAPVKAMLQNDIRVGLGTDGPSSGNTLDIITQFKLFANFHKLHNGDRSAFPAESIVALGTIGGAEALGISDRIGSLEIGKQADLVIVETQSVNMFPMYDPYSALVYSANSKNVSSVFVAGRCVVYEKELKVANFESLKNDVYTLLTSKPESLFNQMLIKS